MANITYMAWNVQNFASQTTRTHLARGAFSAEFAKFVGAMANVNLVPAANPPITLDIIGLMEVGSECGADIQNVANELAAATGVTWYFDTIPSCIGILFDPSALAALSWQSGAKSEGYALLWKNSPNFTMQPSPLRQPISVGVGVSAGGGEKPFASALSLSLRARTYEINKNTNPYLARTVRFQSNGPWIDGYYPSSATADVNSIFWPGARRPAIWSILAKATNTVVPMSIYHAPYTARPARNGAWLAAMAQEVYVQPVDSTAGSSPKYTFAQNAVASGDYNVDRAQAENLQWYANFTDLLGEGAGCAYSMASPSTVALNELNGNLNNGAQIPQTAALADYFFRSIDAIFYRTSGAQIPPIAGVWNLVTDVMAPPVPIGAPGVLCGTPLATYFNYLIGLNNGQPPTVPGDKGPEPAFPNILNWDLLIAGLQSGRFSYARQAAEFVSIFLSDHLPVVLTLNL